MEYDVEFEKEKLIISEKTGNYKVDLRERLIDFAMDTIKFLSTK